MIQYWAILLVSLALVVSCNGVSGEESGFTSGSPFVSGDAGSKSVDFSGAPTSGRAPLMVMFSDLSKGDPSGWVWNFGDGYSSGGENPVHTYAYGGVYSVQLTVQYPDGVSSSHIKEGYIQAYPLPLDANFSAVPQSGQAPLTVQFSDRSTGAMVWLWDFGDGSQSMIPNPSHTFTGPGTYPVTLKVSNEMGETDTYNMEIQVSSSEPLSAEFIGSPRSGVVPLTVQFTDQSGGEIISRAWDFGDGTGDSVKDPCHSYNQAGTYPVSLTIWDIHGNTDSETKSQYIIAHDDSPTGGSIPVSAGWNFVSVPRNLAPGQDTARIFEHLDVAGHSALLYEPSRGWVPLLRTTQIKPLMAVWVYSTKSDTVPLIYDPASPVIQPRMLSQGWNTIGFSSTRPIEAGIALSSVSDGWQNCLGFNSLLQRYDPMIIKGVNDELAVQPYGGYWVYMSNPGIFTADYS